jgi:hypothetical protein
VGNTPYVQAPYENCLGEREMTEYHVAGYPEIYNLGHKAIADLLKYPVIVEEKIDGSQFSMCRIDGELYCRSKGQQIDVTAPDKMFEEAVEAADGLDLRDGWTYRGEYLRRPKHNALAYSRIPNNHIMLFDVERGLCDFLYRGDKEIEAGHLGLEVVPILFSGLIQNIEQFEALLQTESILGGQMVEGVVIKPHEYDLFGRDKKVLMGKYVCEKFREINKNAQREINPSKTDILISLSIQLTTEARWEKAVQHLRERGELEDDPRDIGKLIKEVPEDIHKECEDMIKERLWNWAWPKLSRAVVRGLPDWYKKCLLEKQFKP